MKTKEESEDLRLKLHPTNTDGSLVYDIHCYDCVNRKHRDIDSYPVKMKV